MPRTLMRSSTKRKRLKKINKLEPHNMQVQSTIQRKMMIA